MQSAMSTPDQTQRQQPQQSTNMQSAMSATPLTSNATTAASNFYVYPGSDTIFIYTMANDHGWADLCGRTAFSNALTCFGTANWQAGSNGFGTATFQISQGGYYKCFDSFAVSNVDKFWNYGVSFTVNMQIITISIGKPHQQTIASQSVKNPHLFFFLFLITLKYCFDIIHKRIYLTFLKVKAYFSIKMAFMHIFVYRFLLTL